MDSSTSKALADATKLNNDLFELVEKQRIQLNEKDKKLQENRQANEKLLANMELGKTRAIEAATNNLNRELGVAHQTILTYKMAIWKSLTSANLCYYIKVPSAGLQYGYLSASDNGYMCSSEGLPASPLSTARFKLAKNSDGTFSIYSTSKRKYLQGQTNSYQSATYFTLSTYNFNPSKFVLFYDHQQQNKEPGILVDIYSLANGLFLSAVTVGNQTRIMANSRTAPAKKFLLVPVPVEECPVLVNSSNNNDVHFLILIIVIVYISILFYCIWSLF